MDLGRVGIWSPSFRNKTGEELASVGRELEALGFGTVWIPGTALLGDVFTEVDALLDGTDRLVAATGILSIWDYEATVAAARHADRAARHPGRAVLGLGVSHAPLVDMNEPGRYRQPVARMVAFLDELEAQEVPLRSDVVLAALGPRMLELAATRTAGAHPYLVTPEHTAGARATMGVGPVLAPELAVAITTDPAEARAMAREHLAIYLGLPNYYNNWLRLGFSDDDFADGGSDRLVDALVAWGDLDAIGRRIREHLDAGADHVCLQALGGPRQQFPTDAWKALAVLTGL
jgi:probable F420-dependent oxidoreductase